MTTLDVLVATKEGRVKDVILIPLNDNNLEYAARHALYKIYGIENVFVGMFEIGSISQDVVRAIVENPVFIKKWIPFTKLSAPGDGKRVLVKMTNKYINIASYFYRSDGGIWKLDNGQEINTVDEWKGLEE